MSEHDATTKRADGLVMFGLTGDLGSIKLFPALYELAASGRLDGITVIGAGRSEHSDDALNSMFHEAMEGVEPAGGGDVDPAIVDGVDLRYVSGDSTKADTYDRLLDTLGDVERPVVYAAVPPDLFGDIAAALSSSRFPDTTRLVVEKPFGTSADDARSLYDTITGEIDAEHLFIVDHFLAKAAVENLVIVRSNAILHNSLHRGAVDRVEVVMKEEGDVEGRGSFYEGVGVVDDVVQNHLLQSLAMAMMDQPVDDSDDALISARRNLLSSMTPADPGAATFGQYRGYRDVEDVADDSTVATFVSLTTSVDSDRWRGVPITITTGKALDETVTTITFHLSPIEGGGVDEPNQIVFELKPQPRIVIDLQVLSSGDHRTTDERAIVCGPDDHGDLGDYATMLDNALTGERRHFADIDGVIAAWKVVDPLNGSDVDPEPYEPGSTGPA